MSSRKNHYNRLLSLLRIHGRHRRAIQQIHCHLLAVNQQINTLALWNSVLKHYALGQFPQDALSVFKYLRNQSIPLSLDSFTYLYLIKACANTKRKEVGYQLHCLIPKVGFDFHVHVQTALLNMYSDSGCLVEAKKVFDGMSERNLVTWNVLLTGFVKWGEIETARAVFDEMPEKNVVSWTGLIDGYTRVNRFHDAISLFRKMVVHEGIKPTEVTLLAVFPSISNAGSLELCEMIHAYVEKSGLNALDVRVINCLIDAYSRIGSIETAQRIFEEINSKKRNLVSWTSVISGFGMNGMAAEALDWFGRMEKAGVKPNSITFLSVLTACSRGGLVVEGLEFYRKMVEDYEIAAETKHYGALIDMLGRAGRLEEAEKIALGIPNEIGNVVLWRILLGACSVHGNVKMGERVTRKIMELEKKYGGDYVLLSNLFCGADRFVDSERVRRIMDYQNAPKLPGITLSNCRYIG